MMGSSGTCSVGDLNLGVPSFYVSVCVFGRLNLRSCFGKVHVIAFFAIIEITIH